MSQWENSALLNKCFRMLWYTLVEKGKILTSYYIQVRNVLGTLFFFFFWWDKQGFRNPADFRSTKKSHCLAVSNQTKYATGQRGLPSNNFKSESPHSAALLKAHEHE